MIVFPKLQYPCHQGTVDGPPQVHILLIHTDLYFQLSAPGEREVNLKYHHSASRHRQGYCFRYFSFILC